jgi:hypothetical protein
MARKSHDNDKTDIMMVVRKGLSQQQEDIDQSDYTILFSADFLSLAH